MDINEDVMVMLQRDLGFNPTKDKHKPIQSSPRCNAIKYRSRLDSTDLATLDEHDQFYRDHKVLLFLFAVMGVMPVQREKGRVTFHWGSIATIYSSIFYFITSVLVLLVGYERWEILMSGSKKFDEYIYGIIFLVFLLPHFWIPFIGWGVAQEVTLYKNFWSTFQVRFYRVTGRDLEFPHLQTLIVVISFGCLIFAIAFLLALNALLSGFTIWHTCAYYHIVMMINMILALWYINCRAIGDAGNGLTANFQLLLRYGSAPPAYIVALHRHLWLDLNQLMQRLGNAYARTYSAYTLFLFLNITVSLYGFFSEIIDHGLTSLSLKEIGLLIDSAYSFSLLYIFCDYTHKTCQQISKPIQNILFGIDLDTVELAAIKEIQLFLNAIEMNPPLVSLKGYAFVNREFLTSSVTKMAMYMIVLLQFKISFKQFNK